MDTKMDLYNGSICHTLVPDLYRYVLVWHDNNNESQLAEAHTDLGPGYIRPYWRGCASVSVSPLALTDRWWGEKEILISTVATGLLASSWWFWGKGHFRDRKKVSLMWTSLSLGAGTLCRPSGYLCENPRALSVESSVCVCVCLSQFEHECVSIWVHYMHGQAEWSGQGSLCHSPLPAVCQSEPPAWLPSSPDSLQKPQQIWHLHCHCPALPCLCWWNNNILKSDQKSLLLPCPQPGPPTH